MSFHEERRCSTLNIVEANITEVPASFLLRDVTPRGNALYPIGLDVFNAAYQQAKNGRCYSKPGSLVVVRTVDVAPTIESFPFGAVGYYVHRARDPFPTIVKKGLEAVDALEGTPAEKVTVPLRVGRSSAVTALNRMTEGVKDFITGEPRNIREVTIVVLPGSMG